MVAIPVPSSDDVQRSVRRGAAVPVADRSDRALVTAVGRGCRRSFDEVYRRYQRRVRMVATATSGAGTADDVVQEVFLRLWTRPSGFDPSRGPLGWYLAMQARGRSIDQLRAEGRRRVRERRPVELEGATRSVADASVGICDTDETEALLGRISEPERTAIVLAFYGGCTYCEVASALGLPEGTVKSRIRSGLSHLRQLLDDDHRRAELAARSEVNTSGGSVR